MAADRDGKFIVEFEDGTRTTFSLKPQHSARAITLLGSLLAIDQAEGKLPKKPIKSVTRSKWTA